MQFAFTEDQLTITQAARDMLVETCTPADLRKLLDSGQARDDTRWATISEMGLIGMLAPEAAGGLGMAIVDLIGIAEAAGYVGLPEPLVEQAGVVVPLLAGLADNRGWLDKVLAGAVIAIGSSVQPVRRRRRQRRRADPRPRRRSSSGRAQRGHADPQRKLRCLSPPVHGRVVAIGFDQSRNQLGRHRRARRHCSRPRR